MRKMVTLLTVSAIASTFAFGAVDVEKFWKNCKGCHGEKGEKKAGNRSLPIGSLPRNEIVQALKDYRSGKRNKHEMGAVMKSEALNFTDEEIEAIATFVAGLRDKK